MYAHGHATDTPGTFSFGCDREGAHRDGLIRGLLWTSSVDSSFFVQRLRNADTNTMKGTEPEDTRGRPNPTNPTHPSLLNSNLKNPYQYQWGRQVPRGVGCASFVVRRSERGRNDRGASADQWKP